MHIVMLASENDSLAGGKVGGLADVVRDAPAALAQKGCKVSVVVPSYNFLHTLPGARRVCDFSLDFRHTPHPIDIYTVPANNPHPAVDQFVLHHPALAAYAPNRIYHDDPPQRPFATDANRFALFCSAAATALALRVWGDVDCLHLHDWPTALLLVLRRFDPACSLLAKIRTVFTIHNLALQGVRPLAGDDACLEAWLSGTPYDWFTVADRRWTNCVNPMAAAVRLADAVHVVSPTYAAEILQPSRPPVFFGGEGLEVDLVNARDEGRLTGILNGCAYPADRKPPRLEFAKMLAVFQSAVIEWAGDAGPVPRAHFAAYTRLNDWIRKPVRPGLLLTSVSRLADQKVLLLRAAGSDGRPGLEGLLTALGEENLYILLGTGSPENEAYFTHMSARHPNFIFLNGFSNAAADLLYANGGLFVMPSSFEPCGISQMLALRDGQPCLVHAVGGLKDTVKEGVNGFCFGGDSLPEQVDSLVASARSAMRLFKTEAGRWQRLRKQAAASRFSWDASVRHYIEKLYVNEKKTA
ncbi:MAG: glycogen/starch synthase [Desulfobacterales bacterium]